MDLAKLPDVGGGLAIDMLNYKKALLKDTIRILAEKFKLSQVAFNMPYKLRAQTNAKSKKRRKTSVGRNLAKAS